MGRICYRQVICRKDEGTCQKKSFEMGSVRTKTKCNTVIESMDYKSWKSQEMLVTKKFQNF